MTSIAVSFTEDIVQAPSMGCGDVGPEDSEIGPDGRLGHQVLQETPVPRAKRALGGHLLSDITGLWEHARAPE
jgi:hypothetical protein